MIRKYLIDLPVTFTIRQSSDSFAKMPRLSQRELQTSIRLVEEGHTHREVARILNVAHGVINRAMQRYRATGDVGFRQGGGRGRTLTIRQEHQLRVMARRSPTKTAGQLNNSFREATGVQVSSQTIRRRLHEHGLRSRKRAKCPLLTRNHRAARRQWARQHLNWGIGSICPSCRIAVFNSVLCYVTPLEKSSM